MILKGSDLTSRPANAGNTVGLRTSRLRSGALRLPSMW
eukprot:CAMPEP_0177689770 /NCGR_PEP_ID=MMETSP0484_2-20121128/387_1 /TAXON_ID=354590 /ORGANISM="Rhodomonas lens, Strain RHODO" /LENGTH=37 /DNA_ID= /DNA_START= /DNA_END= /DNA_ORIENTATION=